MYWNRTRTFYLCMHRVKTYFSDIDFHNQIILLINFLFNNIFKMSILIFYFKSSYNITHAYQINWGNADKKYKKELGQFWLNQIKNVSSVCQTYIRKFSFSSELYSDKQLYFLFCFLNVFDHSIKIFKGFFLKIKPAWSINSNYQSIACSK